MISIMTGVKVVSVLLGVLAIDQSTKMLTGESLSQMFIDVMPKLYDFFDFIKESFQAFAEMLPIEMSSILNVFITIMFIYLLFKFFKR